jgi:uncharacterized protein YacL (UPF0231 family)
MKFYHDEDGNPRVEPELSSRLLGHFLTEDIQDSPPTCSEILRVIERISSGEMASWRLVGNAHVLSLSADEVIVESLFDPSARPCRLSLVDFREILRSWLHFLESE